MEIGIVGKPNVGKSTFFKALTLADSEISNFPFTTIKPNIGVGAVRRRCQCKSFNVNCNPNNSLCIRGNRFIPVKLIDVAGLVPGAHEGRGLGNQFLDDLRRADVLIHIIDISGRTNEKGEPTKDHDPEIDIKFLEDELDMWFYQILKKNWSRIISKAKHTGRDIIEGIRDQLSGLELNEFQINKAVDSSGLRKKLENKVDLSDDEIKEFSMRLRDIGKPILMAANKIDIDSEKNFERLKKDYKMIPLCSDAELALRNAHRSNIIDYIPGDSEFKIIKDVREKQRNALRFIEKDILKRFGSTGAQDCINYAVFDILALQVVYPVENENKLTDSKGNVLPDAYLLAQGSKTLDLAYKIHTDIGDKFIGAIDCKTKKKIGREHILKDGDVIKILMRR